MNAIGIVTLVAVLSPSFQGCSVHMAINQPEKVDYKLLEQGGMPRDLMVTRMGIPVSSIKNEDGTRTDVFQFYEGSATEWKYGRAAFNFAADVASFSLWELVAWPVEVILRGDKITATADFDKKDTLVRFVVHRSGNIATNSK